MQSVTFGTYLTFRKSVKRVVYFPQVFAFSKCERKTNVTRIIKNGYL